VGPNLAILPQSALDNIILGQGRDRMGDNGVVPPGDNGHQDQHQGSIRVDGYDSFGVERDHSHTPFIDQETEDIRTSGNGEAASYRSYPFSLNIGRAGAGAGASGQHMISPGYELDYEEAESVSRARRNMQDFDGYNLACASAYSPSGPEMGSYSARTVVTYQTSIETAGMRGHGPLSWGAGGVSGVGGVPHKWADEREELEPRLKKQAGVVDGNNFFIPDHTLAQLTVKELNKRVSQNLGREDVIALKQRRRTLKNRGYAVQCRLRRQQYKESLEMEIQNMRDNMKKVEEEMKNVIKQRDYFHSFYERCCGSRVHQQPLNLDISTMNNINNNHDQDFKTARSEIDFKMSHQAPVAADEFRREYELTGGYGRESSRGGVTFKMEPEGLSPGQPDKVLVDADSFLQNAKL